MFGLSTALISSFMSFELLFFRFLSYFVLAHTLFACDFLYTSIYLFVDMFSLALSALVCVSDNWIIYTYLCFAVVLFLFLSS